MKNGQPKPREISLYLQENYHHHPSPHHQQAWRHDMFQNTENQHSHNIV